MLGYINVSETYLKKNKTIKTILDNEVVQTGLTFFFFLDQKKYVWQAERGREPWEWNDC